MSSNPELNNRVAFIPAQPHSLMFGGFEIQMNDAFSAIKGEGVDVTKLNFWDRNADFDVAHFWGLEEHHYNNMLWIKKHDKKIVLTALIPYLSLGSVWWYFTQKYFFKSKIFKVLQLVDVLVLVNDEQELFAKKILGFRGDINIIPNIVNRSFFIEKNIGIEPTEKYLLCPGNICVRKKQLILASAAVKAHVKIVFVGSCVPSEEDYYHDLKKMALDNPKYLELLAPLLAGSNELVSLFTNAHGVAMISDFETQPIALLEGLAKGCSLIVSSKKWSQQSVYSNALRCNGKSVDAVSAALVTVIDAPRGTYSSETNIASYCSSEAVGMAYAKLYEDLV